MIATENIAPSLKRFYQGLNNQQIRIIEAFLTLNKLENLQCGWDDPRSLLVTDKALQLDGKQSVYGYAMTDQNIAIVSTRDLWVKDNPRRLLNVIAHELGHLDGYGHCENGGCVMKPVHSLDSLDVRSFHRCGSCPQLVTRSGWIHVTLVCVTMMLLFALIN